MKKILCPFFILDEEREDMRRWKNAESTRISVDVSFRQTIYQIDSEVNERESEKDDDVTSLYILIDVFKA